MIGGGSTKVGGYGESPADTWRIPERSERTAGMRATIATGAFLVVAALVGGQLLMAQVTAFRTYDAVLVIVAAILPTELALAWFFFSDHPLALGRLLARENRGSPLARLDRMVGIGLIVLILPAAAALFANQRLDRSPGIEQTLTIGESWIRYGRHGSRSCMVSVTADVRRPMRFGSFYGDSEAIRLPCAEWEHAVPGRSALSLTVRPGFLGFPWYADPMLVSPGAGS